MSRTIKCDRCGAIEKSEDAEFRFNYISYGLRGGCEANRLDICRECTQKLEMFLSDLNCMEDPEDDKVKDKELEMAMQEEDIRDRLCSVCKHGTSPVSGFPCKDCFGMPGKPAFEVDEQCAVKEDDPDTVFVTGEKIEKEKPNIYTYIYSCQKCPTTLSGRDCSFKEKNGGCRSYKEWLNCQLILTSTNKIDKEESDLSVECHTNAAGVTVPDSQPWGTPGVKREEQK